MAPHAPAARLALAGLLAALLAACGQEITGTTSSTREALYFADSPSGLPPLYTGEVYAATLTPAGGAGPYTARLAGGTLPPGLTLSGLNLSGTPSKTGTYTFTVEITDSTLSTRSKEYRLTVQDLPALSLAPTLPAGEIRGDTRIPVTISAPRTVRAARLVWDLPAGVSVSGAQPGQTGGVLFWRQDGQRLTVDVGFKSVPRSGARVALLNLKVTKPVTLTGSPLGFEARDGQGKLLSEKLMPDEQKKRDEAAAKAAADGAAAEKAAPGTAAPTTPAPTTPVTPTTPATAPVSPAPAGPPDPAAPTPPGSTPREGTPPGGTP